LRADEMRFVVGKFPSGMIDVGYNCKPPDRLFVFNRAAVGPGIGVRDGFAAHRFIERSFNVIGRARNVGWVGRSFAVDRAFINDFALGLITNMCGVLRAL
jgi:hypothetical protein